MNPDPRAVQAGQFVFLLGFICWFILCQINLYSSSHLISEIKYIKITCGEEHGHPKAKEENRC